MLATSRTWDLSLSPFVKLVGTNHAPSPDQLLDLKTLLIKPCAELERLEVEIARALCEKEKIKNFIEAHRALMSPVRQIPDEVLGEIFVHCLPTDRNAIRSLDEAPLLLTTICRDWRRVALNTHRLWSSLHIFLPPHLNNQAMSRRVTGIRTWLGRSGTLPLSISFHTRSQPVQTHFRAAATTSPDFYLDYAKLLISTIASFGDRFGDLFLSLPPLYLKMFDELSRCPFPALQHFRVRDADVYNGCYPIWSHAEGENYNTCFAPLLARMVALKSFHVSNIHVGVGGYLALPVNWGILTDLNLQSGVNEGIFPSEVSEILQRTPNLRSLYICFMLSLHHDYGLNTSTPIRKIILPHLRTMQFDVSPSRGAFEESDRIRSQVLFIFGSFSTPSLKLLAISGWNGDGIINLKSIHDHSEIPFHNLETLELALELTPEELTECLASAPELVSLQLKSMGVPPCFSDSHLSALTPSHGNPTPLCPRLAAIQIIFSMYMPETMITVTSPSILNFARSRAKTLKTFDMYFDQDPPFAEDDLAALRKLKKDGLNVRLHYADYPVTQQDSPLCGLPSDPVFQSPMQAANRNQISDMEGIYGTKYIV